ncbi:E3 ubiquitin-protein ligase RNF170-like isoform X2 [Lycorma delicatula]|uniref:E3 ubiquitin-protein ligase RNF170-like isoform X2 n=1 Tax=Lycorma delicatula TaxID=130591 RepID=UPI003F50E8C6
MPVSDSSESLVYGFGNEIIITFSIFIVLLPLLVYYLFENYRSSSQNGRQGQQSENELYSNGQQEVPQIYNNGQQCVICLNEQRLAVETSCGHVYCGLCLRQLYDHLNYRLLLCPICRQPVTIIFIYFTDSEREAGSDDDIAESRSDVYSFVTHYNGRFSNRPRSNNWIFLELVCTVKYF